MNSELRKQIRVRVGLHHHFRIRILNSDLIKYKRHRNKVNNMKKYVLVNFYENVNGIIDNSQTSDLKSYWKLITRLKHQVHPIIFLLFS